MLIGVDGSAHGAAAVEHGFRYASRHGLAVQAIHVQAPPAPGDAGREPPGAVDPAAASALRMVTGVIEPWAAKFPEVDVRPVIRSGPPPAILAEASGGASLVVVGSLGAAARPGSLLGSVSGDLLRHAQCPVAVAR